MPVGIELAINAPALPRTVLDGGPDTAPRSEEFRAEDWVFRTGMALRHRTHLETVVSFDNKMIV
jgi:hypothetical protein